MKPKFHNFSKESKRYTKPRVRGPSTEIELIIKLIVLFLSAEIKSMEPDWPKFDVSAAIKTQMETKYASEVELYRYVVEELHKKSRELSGK